MSRGPERAAQILQVTEDEFDEAVLASPVPVLVDFWADWCAPCAWLDPVLEALAAEARGRFRVAKVDVDAAPELAARYRIASVPTVILFRGGEEAGRSLGVEPERLRTMLGLPRAP